MNKKCNLKLWGLTIVIFIICVCGLYVIHADIKTYTEPLVRYRDSGDITIHEQTIKGIALTEKKNTFTKDGIPYIQFEIEVIESEDDSYPSFCDKPYVFTQEKLESIVGKGNNAFDYEEYTLRYTAVIQKDSNMFGKTYSFASKHEMSKGGLVGIGNKKLHCPEYSVLDEVDYLSVSYDQDKNQITLYLDIKPRVNFLGETEFTEEDKERHIEMVDNMCRDILRMMDGQDAQLTWESRSPHLWE